MRLNSTRDTNYGADSEDQIEKHYYRVGAKRKRFFDQPSVERLFASWRIVSLREMDIDRYAKKKTVWEVVLRVA